VVASADSPRTISIRRAHCRRVEECIGTALVDAADIGKLRMAYGLRRPRRERFSQRSADAICEAEAAGPRTAEPSLCRHISVCAALPMRRASSTAYIVIVYLVV
jgi:hypothetical protein